MSRPETITASWSARAVEQNHSTARALLFELSDTTYAVSVEFVRRVIELPTVVPVAGSSDWLLGMANVDGLALALVDTQSLLHNKRRASPESMKRAIFIDSAQGNLLLAVDQITTLSDLSGSQKHRNSPVNYPSAFLEFSCELNGVTIGVLDIVKLFRFASVAAIGRDVANYNNDGEKA